MPNLKIAQIGCGGMGLRHVYAHTELQRVADSFDLVAVCDINQPAADYVAAEAESALGTRPRVYTEFDVLLGSEGGLDAVDIVTDVGLHHVIAIKAYEAGLNVAVEKPLGVTVRACSLIIEAARKAGKVLSVEENHRRDPVNRLVKAIMDSGILGCPRLMHVASFRGTRHSPHGTAWRQIKKRGGYLLDYGVHEADLFEYFLGEIDTVYAETRLWEPVRYNGEKGQFDKTSSSWALSPYYAHRVREKIEMADTINCTSEDMSLALLRFKSGAIGYYGRSIAAPGKELTTDIIYCEEGSIQLPGSRSGNPVHVTMLGKQEPIAQETVIDLVPRFEVDDSTSVFFDGRRKISSYDYNSAATDRKFIAMGLKDFADSIHQKRQPEVTGQIGLTAVALIYAMLESGHIHQPIALADIVNGKYHAYQDEVNQFAKI